MTKSYARPQLQRITNSLRGEKFRIVNANDPPERDSAVAAAEDHEEFDRAIAPEMNEALKRLEELQKRG